MLEAKSKSLYQLDLFQLQVTGSPTEIWPNQKGDILTSITECPEVRLIEGVSVFRLRHCCRNKVFLYHSALLFSCWFYPLRFKAYRIKIPKVTCKTLFLSQIGHCDCADHGRQEKENPTSGFSGGVSCLWAAESGKKTDSYVIVTLWLPEMGSMDMECQKQYRSTTEAQVTNPEVSGSI
jgi:hypothetical protein